MNGQTGQSKPRFNIQSGAQAIIDDVPDIIQVVEGICRASSKIAVIAKWKQAKSFFVKQLGISIASAIEFVGFKTTALNVLYINLEISDEMLRQRIQDMERAMPTCNLARFKFLTLPELRLDVSTEELEAILDQCIADSFSVQVLIIDPRYKAITRDSNQDEVVRAFCVNVDKIIAKYKLAVIIVHHEGVASGQDRAGKGSTVFDAWLDGWVKIKPSETLPNQKTLDIWSRDMERQTIHAEFDYPIFRVSAEAVQEKKTRTKAAKDCIVLALDGGIPLPEKEVRYHVLKMGHTQYAFWAAKRELADESRLLLSKAVGQAGNRKLMQLVSHP